MDEQERINKVAKVLWDYTYDWTDISTHERISDKMMEDAVRVLADLRRAGVVPDDELEAADQRLIGK